MKNLILIILLQSIGLFVTGGVRAAQVPVITAAKVNGTVAVLSGQKFGSQCKRCEVIADYKGLKYSLPVKQWQDQKIVVHYADLGRGLKSSVTVVGAHGISKATKLIGKPVIVPARRIGKFIESGKHSDLQVHTRKYADSIGGKGEDKFDVSSTLPSCGQVALVFEKADIVSGRRTRFGEAKIVSLPARGCEKCAPVKVRYYWEPTGKLEYQLHVYRKQVSGICRNRVRR